MVAFLLFWMEGRLAGRSTVARLAARADRWLADRPRRQRVAVTVVVAAATLLYLFLGIARYEVHQNVNGFDLGVFAQSLWNTSKGNGLLTNSLEAFMAGREQASHFAFHNQPVLFAFLPLYWLTDSPLALVLAQVLLLPLGAFALYLLTVRRCNSGAAGLALAIAYVLHPSFAQNVVDFHPIALSLFLIPVALLAFEAEAPRRAWLLVALLVMCKENLALVGVFFGCYVVLRGGSRRAGAAASGASLGWFVFSVYWLIPAFRGSAYQYVDRFRMWGGSLHEVVLSLLIRPDRLVGHLLGPSSVKYLFELLLPWLFLPLLSPATLALGLPLLAQNLLSSFPHDRSLGSREAAPLLAILACASAQALARVTTPATDGQDRRASSTTSMPAVVALATLLLVAGLHGRGFLQNHWRIARDPDRALIHEVGLIKDQIGEEDHLSVHMNLVYLFSHRAELSCFPVGATKANKVLTIKGWHTWPKPETHARTLEQLRRSPHYRPIFEGRRLVLFERRR